MTDTLAAHDLAPGTIIAGRYKVDKCVGRGGMGAVYLVRHTNTDERLALKVLHATVLSNAMAVERFRREARAPAQIDSDHVVRVTDADTAPELGGAPFLVMEFLKGNDLEREVERVGPIPPDRVVTYLRQAARALDKAHGLGIVHRDLKPENLFLTQREDGTPWVKILDFGIAKITGGSAPSLQTGGKTETGTITGTPMFMSPEQIKGDNPNIGPATDIWAIGLIAYRLLTADTYWSAETLPMLVAQIAYEPLPPPSTRVASFSPEFDTWFAKCCARNIPDRFATAGEAVDALERALTPSRMSVPYAGVSSMARTEAVPSVQTAPMPTAPAHRSVQTAPMPVAQSGPALAGSLQGASMTAGGIPAMPARKSKALLIALASIACIIVLALAVLTALMNKRSSTTAASSATHDTFPSAVPLQPLTNPLTTASASPTPSAITNTITVTPIPGRPRPAASVAAIPSPTPSPTPSLSPTPPTPTPTPTPQRPNDNDLLKTQH